MVRQRALVVEIVSFDVAAGLGSEGDFIGSCNIGVKGNNDVVLLERDSRYLRDIIVVYLI